MEKSSIANTMRRYLWLYETIKSSGDDGISKRSIDMKWVNSTLNDSPYNSDRRFTRPTFNKYLGEIQDLFDVSIEAFPYKGDYKRYRINTEDIKQDKTKFMLISALAMNDMERENDSIKEHIMIDDLPDTGGENLSIVLKAIRESRCVEIDYQSYKSGRTRKTHLIAPYVVRMCQMRWYVYGWHISSEHPILLTFEQERMFGCKLSLQTFDKKELAAKMGGHASPKDVFNDYFGVNIGYNTKVADIAVRVFSKRYIGYIRSIPLHHSQQEVEGSFHEASESSIDWENDPMRISDDASADFTYHIHPTIDFIRELASFGSFIKVLRPSDVADSVKNLLLSAARQYEDWKI